MTETDQTINQPKHSYEATIKVHLPGYAKPTECKFSVEGTDLVSAIINAQEMWAIAVEPKDIAIKEIQK